MPFMKVDPIAEAIECQEMFKDDSEAVQMFKDYEAKHRDAARIEQNELDLRNRLVQFRRSKNITQKEIEARSGMTQQAISRLETSRDTIPNIKTLLRYADAIDCVLVPQEKASSTT